MKYSERSKCPKCGKDHPTSQYKKKKLILVSDTERINWLERLMQFDADYCEIYMAGLRTFQKGQAETYQIESNPTKFDTTAAPSLREAIDKAAGGKP